MARGPEKTLPLQRHASPSFAPYNTHNCRPTRFVQLIVIRRESALCRFAISRAPDTMLTLGGRLEHAYQGW